MIHKILICGIGVFIVLIAAIHTPPKKKPIDCRELAYNVSNNIDNRYYPLDIRDRVYRETLIECQKYVEK
jgi:hypothetical protein